MEGKVRVPKGGTDQRVWLQLTERVKVWMEKVMEEYYGMEEGYGD